MKRKALALIIMLSFLFSVISITQSTNSAYANINPSPILQISIKSDGSIEPSTVPIKRVDNVYTFTNNIVNSTIEVNCDNIVIDGANFTLQGHNDYFYTGIYLKERSKDITIKNIKMLGFHTGIRTSFASNIIVTGNIIKSVQGLDFSVNSSNNQFVGNTLICYHAGSGCGIWIWGSFNSVIHNNVIDFADNIIIFEGSDRRPSIGNRISENYWSDYNGIDSNSDGTGDSPYIINTNNKDNYPLIAPIDYLTPIPIDYFAPTIEILSPENENYNTDIITLNFTVNEFANISYCLNSGENVTITGNMTLTGLSNGDYNLTIYAKDEAGNMGASETLYFNVEVPEPVPPTLIIASVAIVVIVGLGIFAYFKKRRS